MRTGSRGSGPESPWGAGCREADEGNDPSMRDPLEERTGHVRRALAGWALLAAVAGLIVLTVVEPDSRVPMALVVGIIAMIMLHEAGHFIAARRTGMKATEFFLGFGPRIWSFRRGETEFGVKAIPLGGYVRIIGMHNLEEVPPEDEPRTYRRQRARSRLIVVLAGVTVNVLLAVVLLSIMVTGRGEVPDGLSTKVSGIVVDSAAHVAGLSTGDRIVAIDGRKVDGWDDLKRRIEQRPDVATTITVRRNGEKLDIAATPRGEDGRGFLGVSPSTAFRSVNAVQAVPESFRIIGSMTVGTVKGIGKLFTPDGVERYSRNFSSDAPKEGSRADLERPRSIVGIVDQGSELIGGDFWALLGLLGGISLILALFNVLPLLPFDGGHAAIVVYEAIASRVRGREIRVDYVKLQPVAVLVLAVFLTLGLSAMFLDVRQAIGQ